MVIYVPKEWILNSATNRFQLNYSRNVGKVSEDIRKCTPKSLEEWEDYYYKNVYPKNHLISLGKRLFVKITEVLQYEIESISEEDCINYIINLVINRTFDGYTTEIRTIYGQLENLLEVTIFPAPDEWDRQYNVDFYIEINEKTFIGIQIKPVSNVTHIPQIYKEHEIQKATHEKFKQKYGGNVFYVISTRENKKKVIQNKQVITQIKDEMNRLAVSTGEQV